MNNSSEPSQTLTGEAALAAIELERRRRHRARLAKHTEQLDAWREDFVAFAAELDVIDKEGVRVRVQPTAMLSHFELGRSGRDIVLKPRQVFFTTWEMARDLWWLVTQTAHVVVIAPSDSEGHAIRELASLPTRFAGKATLAQAPRCLARDPRRRAEKGPTMGRDVGLHLPRLSARRTDPGGGVRPPG